MINHRFPELLFLLPRWLKRLLLIVADSIMLPLALWSSYAMRLGTWTPEINDGIWLFFLAPLISIPIFIRLGLYRAVIRFIGAKAFNSVFKGVSISLLIIVSIVLFMDLQGIPRSVLIIYWGTAFLFIGGSRHLIRRFYHLTHDNKNCSNVAIYGTGNEGIQLAQALFSSENYRPALFLDHQSTMHKATIHGLKVYSLNKLPQLIKQYHLKQVLLAIPSVSQQQRQSILTQLEKLPIHVRTIPSLSDLIAGSSIAELQEIDVDDLLGRPSVPPDHTLLAHCITGKNVMVTGAGGSIGSELCRQVIKQKPKKLILFEISEVALYQIEKETQDIRKHSTIQLELLALLGSVQNQSLIEKILKDNQVHTLYHAAAYKHVPLVEHNIIEGLRNNVFGTYRTASAAATAGVEHFVLVSTDKAVRPTNIMGASKRIAELGLQALAKSSQTTFSMVRFGNVLDSSGSVVPLFRKQIATRTPITVTHPDIIRYFMTIPEAAQLVIQAGAMAKGGEVFLLNMGKPIKILDLAKRMIHLSGLEEKSPLNPNGDITIEFTGLRPGEKLYEELLINGEAIRTFHPGIYHAHEESIDLVEYQELIGKLLKACEHYNTDAIYTLLESYVDGYQHSQKIES